MDRSALIAAGLLAGLLATGAWSSPREEPFRRSTMTLPTVLEGMSFGDVDGDGLDDIIVFIPEHVWYYLQRPDHTFAGEPDGHRDMPAGTTLYTFEDVDGDGRRDLFTLTDTGFRVLDLLEGQAVAAELPDPRRCLFFGLENFAPGYFWAFFRNTLGDLPHELVLPARNGFLIHEMAGPRRGRSVLFPYEVQGSLAIDQPSLEARVRKITRVPRVEFLALDDVPGDELVVSRGATLETWTLRPDGEDEARSPQRVLRSRLTLVSAAGRDGFRWFPGHAPAPEILDTYRLCDLDGDGHADLYRFDDAGREFVFVFGAAGDRRVEEPDRRIKTASGATQVQLSDLDGDGLPELLIFEERDVREPRTAMMVLLRGSMGCRLSVFANQGERRLFRPHPSYVTSYVTRPAVGSRWGSFDMGLRVIFRLNADLDGDGVRDLVAQPGDGKLRFHRGARDTVFQHEVWYEIEIPSDAAFKDITCSVWDFDRDGRDDLLLHYRGWDGSPAEKLLLLSPR